MWVGGGRSGERGAGQHSKGLGGDMSQLVDETSRENGEVVAAALAAGPSRGKSCKHAETQHEHGFVNPTLYLILPVALCPKWCIS